MRAAIDRTASAGRPDRQPLATQPLPAGRFVRRGKIGQQGCQPVANRAAQENLDAFGVQCRVGPQFPGTNPLFETGKPEFERFRRPALPLPRIQQQPPPRARPLRHGLVDFGHELFAPFAIEQIADDDLDHITVPTDPVIPMRGKMAHCNSLPPRYPAHSTG